MLANDEVMLTIGPGEHGSTYGGNPLACAVAMEALDVLEEEGLAANATAMGELLRQGLLASGSPVLRAVRGRGLLNAVVRRLARDWNFLVLLLTHHSSSLLFPTHFSACCRAGDRPRRARQRQAQ